jgi:hypothetical protein
MKAGIFFTGSGPIMIVTSHESLTDDDLIEKLQAKGIGKYIAFEVPIDSVRRKYGRHYEVVMNDLKQEDDLRVMDFDGRHILSKFSFKELGEPSFHEPELLNA